VSSEAEAAEALARVNELDRNVIRARFEARFTAQRMAEDYLDVYESLIVPKRTRLSLVG
jgi:glycosyltransferase involved in cell wall biosynthesis